MTSATPRPQRPRTATSRPSTTAHLRAELDDLNARVTRIVFGLCRGGAVFDSPWFAGKLAEIGTALAAFGEDLGVQHSSADDGGVLREPLLSAQEMARPMHGQQTLQVLRVLERLNSLFDAVAGATAEDQRRVALSELATTAAVYGHRLERTAQLLTVRHNRRAQRPIGEIAAELGITELDVEQMLREAQALVDGPLEQPAPPPWRPCPTSAHTER